MANHFVHPDGSATGSGSITNPVTMDVAVGATSAVVAGDNLYMLTGTYTPMSAGTVAGANITNGSAVAGKGVYTFLIDGTSGNNIIVRPYPGNNVRINGAVHIVAAQSNYITLRGLEIAATPTTRTFVAEANVDYPGIYITGVGCELINNYIHDITQIYIYGTGGCTVHGNLIGWTGTEYGGAGVLNGYSIYTHNHNGGDMLFRKNAFIAPFNGFAMGMWSASNNNIRDYYVEDNVGYGAAIGIGSASGTGDDNNRINRNYIYFNRVAGNITLAALIGAGNSNNTGGDGEGLVECTGNYLVTAGTTANLEPLQLKYAREYNIQQNTFICNAQSVPAHYYVPTGAIKAGSVCDYNTYRTAAAGADFALHSALGLITFAQWQAALSQDANSTFTNSLPTTNVTKVVGNDYDHRGFVAIYNWEASTEVTVNISTIGLTDGSKCYYANCLNPGERVYFYYDSGTPTLTVPMAAARWSFRQPTGWDITSVTWPSEPFPAYAMFLIEEDTYVEKPV